MTRRFLACTALPALAALAVCLADARPADACGGCFHGPPAPSETETVVTDHRMVFSISPTQTVLWDQIRYAGNPAEFAWVLPVHPGATIQLSHDAWISALDATTVPVVTAPPAQCGPKGGSSPGVGCGSTSAVADNAELAPGPGFADAGVTLISDVVVGPYEAVTVRASAGDSLESWLTTNGFLVPAALTPTLTAYAQEGFDFIALKLRPGNDVKSMQPVRVVSPGADASLPLRMVAAGIGSHVGITLFVVSEGRYHPQNFPDATIDFSALVWDGAASDSNYATLAQNALSSGDGRGWLTEASRPLLDFPASVGGSFNNPTFDSAYASLCAQIPVASCDAGFVNPFADAGSGSCFAPPLPCDDFDVATTGMNQGDVWVTRMRADLPASALVGDLRLEAAPVQSIVPGAHVATRYSDPSYNPCGPGSVDLSGTPASSNAGGSCHVGGTGEGSLILFGLAITGVSVLLRRSRKKSG